ncbi:zinc ribbon domain-containing protein [Thomasclavelia cocleata]|uniref:zinc ribbon domain-containing protein n=1 Tax=Thomasclavelia cocleata TaxID=69824 RepID=UPI002639B60C|nr:zinc ribbon domain-containing protein [Thomasclavelia cocleata]
MSNLKLDSDEGIIIQTTDVERYKDEEYIEVYEMYLTNKNLICVYEKLNGLFSKSEELVDRLSLTNIKVVKNNIQVFEIDNEEYGMGLQLYFKDGTNEFFIFDKEKELHKWYNNIIETIKNNSPSTNIKTQVIDERKESKINENDLDDVKNEEHIYCPDCGEKLKSDSKFCNSCGSAINKEITDTENKVQETTKDELITERKNVYDGYIHKCPNCGEVLKSFVSNCPACGHELRSTKTSSVVNEFAQKIEKVKSMEQKIELIRNFYIPNTKEDIYEFFILATSNISAGGYDVEAWYSKLEQTYHKAKLSFGNETEFQYLNQLYNKTKKQKKAHFLINNIKRSRFLQSLLLGLFGGILVITGFFLGSLSNNPDSPFYMIAMLGLIPLFGAVFAISNIKDEDKDEKKNNKL